MKESHREKRIVDGIQTRLGNESRQVPTPPPHPTALLNSSIIPPDITPTALFIPVLVFLYLVFQRAALSAIYIIIAKSLCFSVPSQLRRVA